MQLKEYFEKFEINPKLWAKRHGIKQTSLKSWLECQRIPGRQTRNFIQHCTLGYVTETDWMEILYGDAYEGEFGTVSPDALGNEIKSSQRTEEACDILVNI